MLDSVEREEKPPLFKFSIRKMSFSGGFVAVPGKSSGEEVDIMICNRKIRAINNSIALNAWGKGRNIVLQKVLKIVSSWVLRPEIACGRYP